MLKMKFFCWEQALFHGNCANKYLYRTSLVELLIHNKILPFFFFFIMDFVFLWLLFIRSPGKARVRAIYSRHFLGWVDVTI